MARKGTRAEGRGELFTPGGPYDIVGRPIDPCTTGIHVRFTEGAIITAATPDMANAMAKAEAKQKAEAALADFDAKNKCPSSCPNAVNERSGVGVPALVAGQCKPVEQVIKFIAPIVGTVEIRFQIFQASATCEWALDRDCEA